MKKLLTLSLLLLSAPLWCQEGLQEVVVNPGDTMWNIANKYLQDPTKWPEIVKVNNLPTADPTLALPGSKIKVPVMLLKEEYRTAQLVKLVPEVRYKRKEDSDFKTATEDMTLKYEDALRTMKGGQARVKFPSKEIVQINENSYVILKPEKIMQEVQLMQGDIRASRAKVIMPGGTVVKPRGNNSEYQAKVKEDESEVVFVYKGEVNVTAQGKTVLVKEGFGTSVPKSAPPIEPMPLSNFKDFNPKDMPSAPKNAPPKSGAKPIQFTPPQLPVKDSGGSGKSKSVVSQNILVSYHVQLARDENFKQLAMEKTEAAGTSFDIKQQPIPDGRYYMRVAFMDAFGVMGPYSEFNTITKDTVAPELSNISPENGSKFQGRETACEVSGTVKGAVLVSINGQVVFIGSDGRFSGNAYLREGMNKIKIIARDANENTTVVEKTVSYSK